MSENNNPTGSLGMARVNGITPINNLPEDKEHKDSHTVIMDILDKLSPEDKEIFVNLPMDVLEDIISEIDGDPLFGEAYIKGVIENIKNKQKSSEPKYKFKSNDKINYRNFIFKPQSTINTVQNSEEDVPTVKQNPIVRRERCNRTRKYLNSVSPDSNIEQIRDLPDVSATIINSNDLSVPTIEGSVDEDKDKMLLQIFKVLTDSKKIQDKILTKITSIESVIKLTSREHDINLAQNEYTVARNRAMVQGGIGSQITVAGGGSTSSYTTINNGGGNNGDFRSRENRLEESMLDKTLNYIGVSSPKTVGMLKAAGAALGFGVGLKGAIENQNGNNIDNSKGKLTRDQFVKQMYPMAENAAKDLGVDPKILLAQAMHESTTGNSDLVKESNNLFGIKTHNWKGATSSSGAFRKYSSPEESFKDYVKFLKENPRYKTALKNVDDPEKYVQELKSAGYDASDPDYVKHVMNFYNTPEVQNYVAQDAEPTELDKLYDKVHGKMHEEWKRNKKAKSVTAGVNLYKSLKKDVPDYLNYMYDRVTTEAPAYGNFMYNKITNPNDKDMKPYRKVLHNIPDLIDIENFGSKLGGSIFDVKNWFSDVIPNRLATIEHKPLSDKMNNLPLFDTTPTKRHITEKNNQHDDLLSAFSDAPPKTPWVSTPENDLSSTYLPNVQNIQQDFSEMLLKNLMIRGEKGIEQIQGVKEGYKNIDDPAFQELNANIVSGFNQLQKTLADLVSKAMTNNQPTTQPTSAPQQAAAPVTAKNSEPSTYSAFVSGLF